MASSNIIKGVPVKGVRVYRSQLYQLNGNSDSRDDVDMQAEEHQLKPAHQLPAVNEDELREIIRQEERKKLEDEMATTLESLRSETISLAEQQAEQVMKDAEKMGYDEGHKKGYSNGEASALKDFDKLEDKGLAFIKEAEEILKNANQKASDIIASSEMTVVELSVAVAEKLLRAQLEVAPQKVINVIREAIAELSDGEHIRIFVNIKDLPVCLKFREELEKGAKESKPELKFIEFVPDEDISRGSCRVESESGSVEYLLEEEKERIKAALMEESRRGKQKRPEEA